MSDQPEALFLADVIENDPQSKAHHDAAAACLRRLHELVDKYKWQVIDTCARAEKAEAERDALKGTIRQQDAEREFFSSKCDALRAALRAMVGVYGNDYHPTAQEALRKARAALKEAK